MHNLKYKGKNLIKFVYWQNNEIRVFEILADFALSTSHLLAMIWLFFRSLCQRDSFDCYERTVVEHYCSN